MAAQYSFVMKGMTKTFPGAPKPVLNNIHLQVYPDAKIGIVGPNGSTWTFEKPSAVSRRTAQARARASASVPAWRGPTSVVSPSRMSQATVSPCSAWSRSVAA